jgi:Protein of unknown function (DUF2608)
MNKIDTFNLVDINKNTLVLCDIDETILFYDDINPKWWKDKLSYYMEKYNDNDLANSHSLEDWYCYIQYNKPSYTDKLGFENMLKRIEENNSTLIFITARNPVFEQITNEHFKHLNIDNLKYQIHYLAGISKGEYIKNKIKLESYNKVIFIDDLEKNIKSVNEIFNDQINTYQFVMSEQIIKH